MVVIKNASYLSGPGFPSTTTVFNYHIMSQQVFLSHEGSSKIAEENSKPLCSSLTTKAPRAQRLSLEYTRLQGQRHWMVRVSNTTACQRHSLGHLLTGSCHCPASGFPALLLVLCLFASLSCCLFGSLSVSALLRVSVFCHRFCVFLPVCLAVCLGFCHSLSVSACLCACVKVYVCQHYACLFPLSVCLSVLSICLCLLIN